MNLNLLWVYIARNNLGWLVLQVNEMNGEKNERIEMLQLKAWFLQCDSPKPPNIVSLEATLEQWNYIKSQIIWRNLLAWTRLSQTDNWVPTWTAKLMSWELILKIMI